jgi:hypothetical protein
VSSKVRKFNDWLGLVITRGVGNMWCAYAFAALTLTSLPENVDTVAHFVQWLSTSFLQLVLLSIILVGQELQGRDSATQATETHDAQMESLQLIREDHAAVAEMVTELHALHIPAKE